MDIILYFFRDTITGTYYFIYAFICLMLMFSIIGYLYKQKYAKVEVKLNTSQPKKDEKVEPSKQVKVENSNQGLNLFQNKQDNKASVAVNGTFNPATTQGFVNASAAKVNQQVAQTVNSSIPRPITEPIPQTVNQPVNPTVQVTPNVINKTVPPVNQQATPEQVVNQTQVVTPVQQTVNKNIEIK